MNSMFLFAVWAVTAFILLFFLYRIFAQYREDVLFGDFVSTYPPTVVIPGALLVTLMLWYFSAYGWMLSILGLTCLFTFWQYRICRVHDGT